MAADIEILRRVYFADGDGACIEIRGGDDGLGIRLHTPDPLSEQWAGKIELTMDKDMAAGLAECLLAASKEQP